MAFLERRNLMVLKMDKICPSCGAKSSEKKFAGDFCVDCYSERARLVVPRIVSALQCRSCGMIKAKGGWVLGDEKNIEKLVLSFIKGEYSNASVELEPVPRIVFLLQAGDSFAQVEKNFEFKREGATCPDCGRKAGGYFEAIVQLRGKFEDIAVAQGKIEKKAEGRTFITKVDELKEGVDLYVASKKAVPGILSSLRVSFTTSNKLFGVRDGQRIYRTTFCVRV
jgi:nonsense-mediated mRNA decay protein 3